MMTRKTRRKIDTSLKAKIALRVVREQEMTADLAHSRNQIYTWKQQLLENAERAFGSNVGLDAEKVAQKIGSRTLR
jgi:transposase-like protein